MSALSSPVTPTTPTLAEDKAVDNTNEILGDPPKDPEDTENLSPPSAVDNSAINTMVADAETTDGSYSTDVLPE